ncbi:PPE family protein [Mycobacterium shinjukuense]|uniref:PPE family protein n=1 Tax=Mycobacterium shinjukuense TaxID=398694 RepID=A0A7I7MMJ3_9MYCO|nr:PPE family protein [Mycobacterium shinjukuense]MCV6984632.1 PPE family protein [Mycobacterium shinjukuense]ORB63567.1 hypothetical protein BST45_17415 [Mycobacterium shinjukuense]BBX73484.1 PPE family protein [Mycobacterium shinjukuense]
MTAALDFATLPPEINSTRMYSGAGSGPMLAAASAWHGLAAELRATALSCGAVLCALTGEEWYGPASASMAAAVAPYTAWLSSTAVQAEQTALQAEAAVAAYEAAFAATVPPPVVAANRAQLMALVATNIFGQNTPAIAATEAQYAEMWAQDGMAMYGYAGSSAAATRLSPFVEPPRITNPSGLAAQAAAVAQASGAAAGTQQSTLSQLISAVPTVLQGLASSTGPASSGPAGILGTLGTGSIWHEIWAVLQPNSNFWNTVTSSGLGMAPATILAPLLGLIGGGTAASMAGEALGEAATGALAGPLAGIAGPSGLGGAVSAGVGNAAAVGTLSVPPSWTAAAPLHGPLGSTLGGTPMVAPPPAGPAGMPGVPFGNAAGQHFGRAVPQYGFRPTFVARPPAAG